MFDFTKDVALFPLHTRSTLYLPLTTFTSVPYTLGTFEHMSTPTTTTPTQAVFHRSMPPTGTQHTLNAKWRGKADQVCALKGQQGDSKY